MLCAALGPTRCHGGGAPTTRGERRGRRKVGRRVDEIDVGWIRRSRWLRHRRICVSSVVCMAWESTTTNDCMTHALMIGATLGRSPGLHRKPFYSAIKQTLAGKKILWDYSGHDHVIMYLCVFPLLFLILQKKWKTKSASFFKTK